MKPIKFSIPNILPKHIKTVDEILKSGWLTHGKYTSLLEQQFKKITNSKYAIAVSSCTAGLHLTCLASNFRKGDEVIVPSQTHTATAHAVEYTGAKAVFTDVDYPTGNITLDFIKQKITKKTKGIIIVHMAGYPCDVKEISAYCNKKKIILIEDCAHAVGTFASNTHVGNFGISGNFSFYPTKQITTGEGGIVITNNKIFYKKIKTLKAFGIDKDINDRKKQGQYDVKLLGLNYRMTDFQASLGYHQAKIYKKNLARRKEIARIYIRNLKNNKNIIFCDYNKDCSYFVFQIFCKNKRDLLLKNLKSKKIGVSIHYANPLPKMSYYKKKYNLDIKNFPNSEKYGKKNISLPIYPKLKNIEINKICEVINNFYK